MQTLRRIRQRFHHILQWHYPWVCFVSTFLLTLIGFLHFELQCHNKDLIYWKNLWQLFYHELEQFAFMLIMLIVLVTIIFVGYGIVSNTQTIHSFNELSQLEVKKRYADFLLLRMIADIDKIEAKYLRQYKTSEIMAFKKIILAHENMKKSVENFRKDAIKLLTPSEEEITLPIEEVYGVLEHEMQHLRRSRFFHMEIAADEREIKKLVNP